MIKPKNGRAFTLCHHRLCHKIGTAVITLHMVEDSGKLVVLLTLTVPAPHSPIKYDKNALSHVFLHTAKGVLIWIRSEPNARHRLQICNLSHFVNC